MGAFVIFESGGSRLALRRKTVARILPAPRLKRPPQAPAALAGFFGYGPDIVTVLRFEELMGGAAAEAPALYAHIILLNLEGPLVALLVDRVSDVLEADDRDRRPVPEESTHRGSVVAEIETRRGSALLLDPARIIAEYERDRVRHFHEEERRRRHSLGDAA